MNAYFIFLITQILLYFLLISCFLVGDTFITYMIFNSQPLNCVLNEPFEITENNTTTTDPKATDPATTVNNTTTTANNTTTTAPKATDPTTTAPAITATSSSMCYSLTPTQLGFIRFKIVVFWILFVVITGFVVYKLFKKQHENILVLGLIIATLIMSVFIIVGGAFLTQFGFTGQNKTCFDTGVKGSKSTHYCFNLNQTELNFAKIPAVLGWLYSVIVIIFIGIMIYQTN